MAAKRRKTEREAPDMAAFMARMARALARRAEGGDLEALSAIRDSQAALEAALEAAARGLHEFGYSWTEIAREFGVSRQAARQRWGAAESA